jgi:hypothetical protein
MANVYKKMIKPCRILCFCPYGELVEEFPVLPPTRAEKIEHNEYLERILKAGKFDDGMKIDEESKQFFKSMLGRDLDEFPEEEDPEERKITCEVFGHHCPAFYVSSQLGEDCEKEIDEEEFTEMLLELGENGGIK